MTQQSTTKEFIEYDLRVAGLIFAKHPEWFVRMDRDHSGRCWFVFREAAKCEEEKRSFFANTAQVSARAYAEAERYLKDQIFAAERRGL